MNKSLTAPLTRHELRCNFKIFLIIFAVLAMYISIIVSMFDPELGKALAEFEKTMPGVMSAFGMVNSGTTLLSFLKTYLYGFLLLIFPMLFELIVGTKLIAGYVDSGAMAYILSSPNSRRKIAKNQQNFLIFHVIFLIICVTILEVVCSQVMFPGDLEIKKLIIMNLGLLCFHICFSGFFFFLSCICNERKTAVFVGAGTFLLFYLLQMLANMGDKFEKLKYATAFTLYDPGKMASGDKNSYVMAMILLFIGVIFLCIGTWRFCKRDLPL